VAETGRVFVKLATLTLITDTVDLRLDRFPFQDMEA
jgi:hypothetical protein